MCSSNRRPGSASSPPCPSPLALISAPIRCARSWCAARTAARSAARSSPIPAGGRASSSIPPTTISPGSTRATTWSGLERSVRRRPRRRGARRDSRPPPSPASGSTRTGSSPLPVDRRNRALALDPKWRRNLAAQCWLWKDHTGWREAARITALAAAAPARSTSPSAATPIPRSGCGRRSGTASTWRPRCSPRPIPGWNWPTGSRRCWPGSTIPARDRAGHLRGGPQGHVSATEWGGLPGPEIPGRARSPAGGPARAPVRRGPRRPHRRPGG